MPLSFASFIGVFKDCSFIVNKNLVSLDHSSFSVVFFIVLSSASNASVTMPNFAGF